MIVSKHRASIDSLHLYLDNGLFRSWSFEFCAFVDCPGFVVECGIAVSIS